VRAPTLRQLLLAANLLIAAVPILAILGLRLIDNYLIRQTERQLIAESVLIAEAWRELRRPRAHGESCPAPAFRPPDRQGERYTPIRAQLDLRLGVGPPPPPPTRSVAIAREPEAGGPLMALLQRAQVFNLSGARVLDAGGCVVASTRGELGDCFDHLPEVRRALAGSYAAAVRERVSDEPPPPLGSIRRRGQLRVFTQTPVFEDGQVIGVVRMSRTAMSPEKLLWDERNRVLQVLLACLIAIPTMSLLLSWALARPVVAITHTAEAIARGEGQGLAPGGMAPREVHSLSAALARMTRQLTDRARYVRDFAGEVSHELKTPIASIGAAAELLGDHWETMEERQRTRFLGHIGADVRAMEARIDALLQLARIENAGAEPSERIDLGAFLGSLAERSDAPVHLALGDAPHSIEIPRLHLESALRNLLDNAARHGGGSPIDLSAAAAPFGRVIFRVRDRGPGICRANRERVFERFFTTERNRGGTGLGLAIVKAVADARNGEVGFETGPEGTCFRVVL
jgi:signal transduction histidine kinase